jgi:putative toxin-antitoxin system antitoxin component (TIGR02293 family)
MAGLENRAVAILGGTKLLGLRRGAEARSPGAPRRAGAVRVVPAPPPVEGALDPGTLGWTGLIRAGLPASAFERVADLLKLSANELSLRLRLPARTIHRRIANGERLTSEETERNVRVARALAKAQQLLGDERGRRWLLEPCRGVGGEPPITMLDTADGFAAVMDELGRLEHGVIS